MKAYYVIFVALFISSLSFGQVSITEIDYVSATGNIEISGPAGTDVSLYEIVFYGGNSGNAVNDRRSYTTIALSGSIDNEGGTGFGALSFTVPGGILDHTNANSGVVLLDNNGIVIEFLNWSTDKVTTFIAKGAPADGEVSTNIGAIQVTGPSVEKLDGGWWEESTTSSFGTINDGLTLAVGKIDEIEGFKMYPNPVVHGNLVISSPNNANKQVEIYSITGSKVFAKSVRSRENINVSNLSTGLYILKVYEEGKLAIRKLLIDN